MAYTTPVEVRKALVPTSDGSLPNPASNTPADLTDDQLTDAIAEADALIDSYVGGFYAVPVAPVNDLVPHPVDFWSRTIAAYLAACTYRGSLDFTDNDPVYRRYAGVLSALQGVSKGIVKLQVPTNETPNAGSGVGHVVNPYVGDLWQPSDFDLSPNGFDPRWNW